MLMLKRIVTNQACSLCSRNKDKETAEVAFGPVEQSRTVYLCDVHLWQFAKMQVGSCPEKLPESTPTSSLRGGS